MRRAEKKGDSHEKSSIESLMEDIESEISNSSKDMTEEKAEIKKECDSIRAEIDNFEKISLESHNLKSKTDQEKLFQELNELKNISNKLISKQAEKLNEANLSKSDYYGVLNIMGNYEKRIINLREKIEKLNFNNRIYAFEEEYDNNGYYKQYVTKSKNLNLKPVLEYFKKNGISGSIFNIEVFENGHYLIGACNRSTETSLFVIFDPNENKLLLQNVIPRVCVMQMKINKDVIFVEHYTPAMGYAIILMTNKLKPFNVKTGLEYASCVDENYIYVVKPYWAIEVHDWSLNKVDSFQIPTEQPDTKGVEISKHKKDKYFVVAGLNLIIYDKATESTSYISNETNPYIRFEIDSNENIILFDGGRRLNYYDVHAKQLKQLVIQGIEDIEENEYNLKFFFDKNSNPIIYNLKTLTCYS